MQYVIILAILLGIDQATKLWARSFLSTNGSIPVIENFFHLTYVENTGAAFGMLQGKIWFFVIATIFAIAAIIYYVKTQKNSRHIKFLSMIATVIIAGAIGNLIDRVTLGFVTDMLDFRGIWDFVFNVADCYVVCGTIALAAYVIKFDENELKNTSSNIL